LQLSNTFNDFWVICLWIWSFN